jgi:exodeoxyribonuclease VII small subunit
LAKKNAYEKNMKRLEEITEKIEQGELDLDKTVELFEEGTKLAGECHEFLNSTELKINKLINGETLETTEFKPE